MQRQVWQKYAVAYLSEDGTRYTLDTTSEHPFWVTSRNEWVSAKELAAGDMLIGPKGQPWRVESSTAEVLSEGLTVYNFTVDQAHTYYVAPEESPTAFVLVHNACHKHHKLPTEIRKKLPSHLRNDPELRNLTVDVEAGKHLKEIHNKKGISTSETGIFGG